MDNFYFDFLRCDSFFGKLNVDFKLDSLDCRVYFVGESCFDNYIDCVEEGVLKPELVKDSLSDVIHLKFSETRSQALLSLSQDFEKGIGDESIAVKGIFITNKDNHVFFYSINTYSVYMTNKIIMKADTILWEDNEVMD